MPIIIALLATIVAFLLGGPIVAIAVLLIGLVVVLPNVMGMIAAAIGAIILLATLNIKFDISLNLLILIIIGILGLLVLIATISENSEKEKKEKKEELQRNRRILDKAGVMYDLMEDSETIQKYSVKPNNNEVWAALKNVLISYGKSNKFEIKKFEENLIKMELEFEKNPGKLKHKSENALIQLSKNEDLTILTFENLIYIPLFVRDKKEEKQDASEQSLSKEKEVDTIEKSSNNIDDLMKLSSLLKEGLITKDEYKSEKSKLLGNK